MSFRHESFLQDLNSEIITSGQTLHDFPLHKLTSTTTIASRPKASPLKSRIATKIQKRTFSPLWYERLCELDAFTNSESQESTENSFLTKIKTFQTWVQAAKNLVCLKAEESKVQDDGEIRELNHMLAELDKDIEIIRLKANSIASIINFTERKKISTRFKESQTKKEKDLLQLMENNRRYLLHQLFERVSRRKKHLNDALSEGPQMLQRFGKLFESCCHNLPSSNKLKLFEALHEHEVDIGRVHATDSWNKLHSKITLNSLDKTQNILLENNNLTFSISLSKDQHQSSWEMVHGTDGPWRVRRYDMDLLHPLIQKLRRDIQSMNSLIACKSLAQVLDAVNLGAIHVTKLINRTPRKIKEILEQRLQSLGINILVGNQSKFSRLRSEADIISAIMQTLEKIEARLRYHGRFYFEAYVHSSNSDAGNLCADTIETSDWMIGLSHNTIQCVEFPGNNEYSFGFRHDGTIWYKGKSSKYTGDLRHVIVLGILIDLNTGSLSFYGDGRNLGPAFGVDSVVFSEEEQMEQSLIIRNKHLIPSFALKYNGHNPSRNMKTKCVPKMSVNFGGFPFSYLPPDSTSCDSYLSFILEAETKQEEDMPSGEGIYPGEASADINTTEGSSNRSKPLGLMVGFETQHRIEFFRKLEYNQNMSWSTFPPRSHQLGLSVSIIQRVCRRYLGYKWRQKEMKSQSHAAIIIQNLIRRIMPSYREKKIQSVISMQRLFRGKKERNTFRFALAFSMHPDDLTTCATKIQQRIRIYQAKKARNQIESQVKHRIAHLQSSSLRIQSAWRRHYLSEERERYKKLLSASLTVQSYLRGYHIRQSISHSKRLQEIGRSILIQKKKGQAATQVERIWRGHSDRAYAVMRKYVYMNSCILIQRIWRSYKVKVKIDELCDSGPAEVAKNFLRYLKLISC